MEAEDPVALRATFGELWDGFGTGSLGNFEARLREGKEIGADRIVAIKLANPDWADHALFRAYCEDVAAGRIKRRRGAPREERTVREIIAEYAYPILLRYLRMWERQHRRDAILAGHHPGIDISLPNHKVAAEIICRAAWLPCSPDTFRVRLSQRRSRDFS